MQVQIKNLGALKQAEFTLGDLTIICGLNNTGKTYATYALFGFLYFWRDIFSIDIPDTVFERLLSEGTVRIDMSPYIDEAPKILSNGCREYEKRLPVVLAASKDQFRETEFKIILEKDDFKLRGKFNRRISSANAEYFSISKSEDSADLVVTLLVDKDSIGIPRGVIAEFISKAINEVLFSRFFPNPFIASAERTGAAIFRKELNFARNRLLEEMNQPDKAVDPMELLMKVYSDYALPVKINVDFTRQLETISKKNSFIKENYPDVLADFDDIIGGEYTVTRNDELFFIPKGNRVKLTMTESSSAVRSLLDIGFYLRHVAQPGDLLMVDEPELNLHPQNQCRVARLFARLVNIGIKVFLTTHSDYIIKELNTLIMLNHDKPYLKKISEREGYKKEELLSDNKIKVYIAEEDLVKLEGGHRKTRCLTFIPADIDPELGIEVRSFDTTIDNMNRIQEEIIWGEE